MPQVIVLDSHIWRAVSLSDVHRDPFDRLIIATALEHSARLASVDGQFRYYPELSNVLMEP